MKICIYGIGAIGGWIAIRFLATNHQLSCVDTATVCAVIKPSGLRLQSADGQTRHALPITDSPEELGVQDIVIVAVRAMDLREAAEAMQPLLGSDTIVLTLCNGIPWWYFDEPMPEVKPAHLNAIDPDGAIRDLLGQERALACVAYPSVQRLAPGVIEHCFGTRFTLGELNGKISQRLKAVVKAFKDAGLNAVATNDIRQMLWLRLMASTSFSLVSLPVQKPLGYLFENPKYRRQIIDIMNDIVTVAKAAGVRPSMRPKELLDMSVLLGSQKPLMLLDLEAGRPLELQALAVAIQEMASCYGVSTPALDAATAIAIEQATAAECYTQPH